MLTLTTIHEICAAHQLKRDDWSDAQNEAVFGHCRNLHGHQYRLEITLTGPLNPDNGMIINEYELNKIITPHIISKLDHHFLNDLPYFQTRLTTVENLATFVFEELKKVLPAHLQLLEVKIFETPTLAATARG